MKPLRLILAPLVGLAACAAASFSRADDAVPKAQPATRYDSMAARSPFMAPSAPAPAATPAPVQIGPHWWDQMVVTSLMEAGGTYFAAVVDRANGKRYVLEAGKADEDSRLVLTDVQWSEHADQSTVIVRRGSEIAPALRFDASAVASTPTGAQQQPSMPSRNPVNLTPPPLPPGFAGVQPPPPPSTAVVHHSGPIGARPAPPPTQGTLNRPAQPPQGVTRQIRPLSKNPDEED